VAKGVIFGPIEAKISFSLNKISLALNAVKED